MSDFIDVKEVSVLPYTPGGFTNMDFLPVHTNKYNFQFPYL